MATHNHVSLVDLLAQQDLGDKILGLLDQEDRFSLRCTCRDAQVETGRRIRGLRVRSIERNYAAAMLARITYGFPALQYLSARNWIPNQLGVDGATVLATGTTAGGSGSSSGGGGGTGSSTTLVAVPFPTTATATATTTNNTLPLSARLRKLDLRNMLLAADEAQALFSAPFPHLTALSFPRAARLLPSSACVAALAAAELPRLLWFEMSCRPLTLESAAAIQALAAAPWTTLEELDLSGSVVLEEDFIAHDQPGDRLRGACAAAFAALAAAPLSRSVRTLTTADLTLPRGALEALLAAPSGWPRLSLWHAGSRQTDELRKCGPALGRAPGSLMAALREVLLEERQLSPRVAAALAARPALRHLTVFSAWSSACPGRGLASCTWPSLRRLALFGSFVGGVPPAHLFPGVTRLEVRRYRRLQDVWTLRGDPEGFRPWALRLEELHLDTTMYPDADLSAAHTLRSLARADWPRLRRLRITEVGGAERCFGACSREQYDQDEAAMRAKSPLVQAIDVARKTHGMASERFVFASF